MMNLHRRESLSDIDVFTVRPDESGVHFYADADYLQSTDSLRSINPKCAAQLSVLQKLEHLGLASKTQNGWLVRYTGYWHAEDLLGKLFTLPPYLRHDISLDYQEALDSPSFLISAAINVDEELVPDFTMKGPFVELLDNEWFRLTREQWAAYQTLSWHKALTGEDRSEAANHFAVYSLKALNESKKVQIQLGCFEYADVLLAKETEWDWESNRQGYEYTDFNVPHLTVKRSAYSIVLFKDQIIPLLEKQLSSGVSEQIFKGFLQHPFVFFQQLQVGHQGIKSQRVRGFKYFDSHNFARFSSSNTDWFAESNEDKLWAGLESLVSGLDEFNELDKEVRQAIAEGKEALNFRGKEIDLLDPQGVLKRLKEILLLLVEGEEDVFEEVGERLACRPKVVVDINCNTKEQDYSPIWDSVTEDNIQAASYDVSNLALTPYEHQDRGIRWLLAHYIKGIANPYGAGALLADDMGLGKTFLTLAAMGETLRSPDLAPKDSYKPSLLLAPLSVIESWINEIKRSFKDIPFKDVVVLHGDGELCQYKINKKGNELEQNLQEGKFTRYLKVGEAHGADRLDMPGRLIITTYDTFTNYHLSLCSVDWAIVAFDEAQRVKSPGPKRSNAVKGLKADLRLAITGTPIENSLIDLWNLMDLVLPGLLGSLSEFRQEFPVTVLNEGISEEEVDRHNSSILTKLRAMLGNFVLQRKKEDHLIGLPNKTIYHGVKTDSSNNFDETLAVEMSGKQLREYDKLVASAREDDSCTIAILNEMRSVSVLPLAKELAMSNDKEEIERLAAQSGKVQAMLDILDRVSLADEKAIVFVIGRELQRALRKVINTRYGLSPSIINGTVPAVPSTNTGEKTRQQLINDFEAQQGFNIILISPLAAGVGLTITGANHAIHMERDWNPATELQATDRVYRIGQELPVSVYTPIATHPHKPSFDVCLNDILRGKRNLGTGFSSKKNVQAELLEELIGDDEK